jgi:5-methylcytosine-specific restriction endonuclease McrBC regulatory subunit McrC
MVDVLDVKYKLPTQRSITNADVYQVVVYAQRFGLDQVHLVYPEPPPWPELHVNGVTIHLHGVDLLDEATELDQIAHAMARRQ